VDDEPFIRDLIRDSLAARNYETTMAASGVEALDVLARDRFDIVITDVVMPGMEGFELLKRVKKSYPSVRVIVLTGYARSANIGDFLLQGADEFLAKPFRPSELLSALRRVEQLIAGGGGDARGAAREGSPPDGPDTRGPA